MVPHAGLSGMNLALSDVKMGHSFKGKVMLRKQRELVKKR